MAGFFHAVMQHWQAVAWSAGLLAFAIICSLIVRWIVFFFVQRMAARQGSVIANSVVHHGKRLSWWFFPLLALLVALPGTSLPPRVMKPTQHAVGILLILVVSWLVILLSHVISDILTARYQMDAADNLLARKVETQLAVLHRVVAVVVILVALAIILMTFPAIRTIGASLLASAGLAGLVVGVAMKPTFSSLVAGIQIALTQPMRIEDVVIVEGEWGWIEEIHTTYVVVRIWDLRRLIVPLSYFIENPFQNWTRTGSDLLGTVLLWVDYTVPIQDIRDELERIVKATKLWKGEVCVLQVTDASERAMQIRALVDARDSGQAWDLRCYVREKLIDFLQRNYPQSLPRVRGELQTTIDGENSNGKRTLLSNAGRGEGQKV
ncbi:MAG TPA: mechanosensitive ion channel domain-containing protein [Candidatus Acidoferrales bacterium]|nr:mechanosensitive ion channel domain-containing protein [Candidatus Acidoferrales bacterium]